MAIINIAAHLGKLIRQVRLKKIGTSIPGCCDASGCWHGRNQARNKFASGSA